MRNSWFEGVGGAACGNLWLIVFGNLVQFLLMEFEEPPGQLRCKWKQTWDQEPCLDISLNCAPVPTSSMVDTYIYERVEDVYLLASRNAYQEM
jgi:hypothetical protein